LKYWLAKPDCPPAIKECKTLLDKIYKPKQDDTSPDLGARAAFRAYLKHNGVYLARSSTHVGNSLVYFYPHGDKVSSAIPGCIKYIFESESTPLLAIQRQLPLPSTVTDPYRHYPHFPAKLFSTQLSPSLEVVQVDWVLCHYARWAISSEHVVVLSLVRVSQSLNAQQLFLMHNILRIS
ncbi:hypothetical protein BV22DRAFT_993464, partial [Leucogyrophana mollusca]